MEINEVEMTEANQMLNDLGFILEKGSKGKYFNKNKTENQTKAFVFNSERRCKGTKRIQCEHHCS